MAIGQTELNSVYLTCECGRDIDVVVIAEKFGVSCSCGKSFEVEISLYEKRKLVGQTK